MYFRETGLPDPAYTASATTSGTMVPLEVGKSIIIYDILSSAACELRDSGSGGGQVMLYVPAGHSNLTSPIKFVVSKPLELWGTANITVTYDIVKSSSPAS